MFEGQNKNNEGKDAKRTFEAYRITKKILNELIMKRYIEVRYRDVRLTRKGRDAALTRVHPVKTQREYYRERKANGYHRKQLWVHEDDVDKFDEFVSRECRP